ncbi:MAG TPA: hypothetical protein VHG08_08275 [Longimicrobium sp.]|nr:hypothetical protein [Longimicrobium sp.]
MGNGKSGDTAGYDPSKPVVPTPPSIPITGKQLIYAIAHGGGVMPVFAEDAVRQILSFANPDEVEELARLLETLYNERPQRAAVDRVRAIRELRDRLGAPRLL